MDPLIVERPRSRRAGCAGRSRRVCLPSNAAAPEAGQEEALKGYPNPPLEFPADHFRNKGLGKEGLYK